MFGKGIKLFNLLGFEVKIDLSWIVIAVLVTWSLSEGFFPFYYKNLSTQTYWIMGIIGAMGLFLSIVAHEFAHSVVARAYGTPMKGITLFIFGGVAQMGEEPARAKAEFMMAIVGPLSSIAIAIAFYAAYRAGGFLPESISGILRYLAWINAILAGFNLLPAFPLDGGRVLRSILWAIKKDLNWATRISSHIGSGFGILLILTGVYSVLTGNFIGGMWWAVLGFFLHGAAKMSYQRLGTRKALEGESVRRFMKRQPVTVRPGISLREFVEDYVYQFHYKLFPVVDDRNRLVGCITTKELTGVPREEWDLKNVGEIAERCSPENTIEPDKDATEALSIMNRNGSSRLMVVEGGRLVGIIALKDMLKFLSLKVQLER